MTTTPDDVKRILRMEPEAFRCPAEAYGKIREQAPVSHIPEADMFVVTGRQEAAQVFKDTEAFRSGQQANVETARNATEMLRRASALAQARGDFADILNGENSSHPAVLPHVDMPAHRYQRATVQSAFTLRRAKASEPMLTDLATSLIDEFIADGQVELRSQYSDPLMVRFVLRELHASPEDAATLIGWVSTFARLQGTTLSDADLDEIAEARVDFDSYFLRRIEDVRRDPVDDVLSKIVHAKIDGTALTTGELLMICQTLLVGGTETSSTTTTNAMLFLARNPDLADSLRQSPELVPKFVEETLRLNGPIQLIFRRAAHDAEVGGVVIPKGARVGVHLGAAGRDPQECPMPDALDLNRHQPQQIMFGYGAHVCAGAALARVQVKVGIEQLLRRWAHFDVAVPPSELSYYPQINFHRLTALPLSFTGASIQA